MSKFDEEAWQWRIVEKQFDIIRSIGPICVSALDEVVMYKLHVTKADRRIQHGRTAALKYRMAWARMALRESGYIESPCRGVWKATEVGAKQRRGVYGPEVLKTARALVSQKRKGKRE